MSEPTHRPEAPNNLRARLRAGDPLRHEGAAAEEARVLARLSSRLSSRIPFDATPAGPRWLAPLAATAALLAAAWLGVRWVEAPSRDAVAPPRATERAVSTAASAAGGAAEPEIRQVQFQTTGGTRVVWVLDPRFAL